MRLPRSLIWIPLALGAAIVAASAPSQAQFVIEPSPMPAPYNYYGPNPYSYAPNIPDNYYGSNPYYYRPGDPDGPGSCYWESLNGRVCRD